MLVALLAGCTGKNVIKITDRNFTDEINQFQNLVFEFNNELVTDSMLNIWDSTNYIEFNPPVKGKFRWETKKQLVFSPSQGFAPSMDYSAKLTNNLSKFLEKKKRVSTEGMKFHTTYLKITALNGYWAVSEEISGQVIIKLETDFNYPVNPGQLKALSEITIGKEKVNFRVLTNNPNNTIEFAIDPPKLNPDESTPIKLVVARGLKCTGSNYQTLQPMEQTFELPPQSQLQIIEMRTGYDEGTGTISVYTTQPVINENIKELISIEQNVEFTVEKLQNGFMIRGNFNEGETYNITISALLKGIFGKEMGKEYSQSVTFAKQEPMLSFTDKNSIYLSSKGERNIGINIINVSRVKLTVFKIFENNILHYMRQGKSYDYYYEGEYEWHESYDYQEDENYGKTIYTREIDSRSLPKNGNISLLKINLNDIEYSGEFKGIYLVKVEATDKKWLKDVQLVSVSDIGLLARQGINNLFIMANSISEAKPMTDVNISLVSSNNQKVKTLKTDKNGIILVDQLDKTIGDFRIAMITARKGDDFNCMLLNNSAVDISRYDAGGKRTKDLSYDVFLYGPRNIYRPGDSVYFNSVIRTFNWRPADKIPLKFKVLLPNGKEFLSFRRTQNAQGASEIRFLLPADIMTGMYSVQVFSGNDVLLASERFSVEEFMPDRISVKVKTDKTEYAPNEEVKLNIDAKNLFGPPAANRNLESELNLSIGYFHPEKLDDYFFSITTGGDINFKTVVEEGKTNEDGNATQKFALPDYKDIGLVEGSIYTTVFDETGRPVNRLSVFKLYTQDIFFGIKYFDTWTDTKKPLKFNFIAVNKKGDILNNAPAKIEIRKFLWENVIERTGNNYRYNSQLREQVVMSKKITVSGYNSFITYTPMQSGEYEIRIIYSDDGSFVSQRFYAYGWGDTDFSSFQVNKEGQVTITSDKDQYKPGEKADILFKTPFSGKIIVTVERDKVFEHYVINTDNKAASLSLRIKDEFLPNIYISATAIREVNSGDMPLTVAHGYLPIKVENPANKLNIKIEAVEKTKSKSKQTITIKTAPNTEMTVAVVDEGILQLTNFSTPEIYDYFYGKRALEVVAYDLYPLLLPELRISSQRPGGDISSGLGRRVNPLSSKRVKLVSLWSGIMKSGTSGICKFTVDVPQFSGALRVMAVAYNDNKFASAEHLMKVADQVVISTALPRFLSPGDEVTIPVTLTNTTNSSISTSVSLTLNGPLENTGQSSLSAGLKPNGENQVKFRIKAKPAIGQAKIKITVNGNNQVFTDETDITIRPAAGLLKITDAGVITGAKTIQFTPKSDLIPGSTKSRLVISKSPVTEFCKDITWLVEYPYGCSEQTISRAFPLIYFRDLAKTIGQQGKSTTYNPDFLVQQAIYKVEARQIYNGGIVMWDGSGDADWWISNYALHFLYEAKQAGFEVNSLRFDNLVKYIQQKTRDSKMISEYLYWDINGNLQKASYAKRETFYSLYLLAILGKQNLPLMNYYKTNTNILTWDSKFMLASAYAVLGDKFSFTQLLPTGMDNKKSFSSFGDCYYSYGRDLAISLYTLLEADPNNKQIGILAKHLSESMKINRWYNTQDRAFGLLALGKLAKRANASKITGTVYIDGKPVSAYKGTDLTLYQDINNKNIKIVTSGSGDLYYFYEVSGISSSGKYNEEDKYIKARRVIYDRFGHPITSNSFAINDLLVIGITVSAMEDRYIENVAVSDILPACFEIENPRISPGRDYTWMNNKAYPEYMDIRDDRITFFSGIGITPVTFYYLVRVVSSGTYQMGPVSVDAMYNGEYHSYNGSGKIVVN